MPDSDTETLTTISPTTSLPIIHRQTPSPTTLSSLPTESHKAFQSWSKTPLSQRQEIVKRALQIMLERQDELAEELTVQMGRPRRFANKEIVTAVQRGEFLVRVSGEALADTPGDAEEGFQRYIRKCPLGVVLVIFAWNYPYLILMNTLIPSLLAGNTLILKPSPQTPTIPERIAEIFTSAGLPPNVISYTHLANPTHLATLIQNPQIALVSFTGSVAGGLAVQKAAAGRVDCRVSLELGGNDPAYVRADVDLAWAADEIVDGAVFNSGQSCCAIERVYVHADVHDEFVEEVRKVLEGYVLGDPADPKTTVGPVISRAAKEKIEKQVEDAIKGGAVDATPANVSFEHPTGPAEGNWVKPTLLLHCRRDMQVMSDETFGPVIPVQKVADDTEAVAFMNASSFGLTASIWTKDVEAGHKLAEEVEAGTVFVNRADFPAPDLAWTGWKESGRGVSLSRFGFEGFVRLKSFHVKDYPVK